MSAWGFCEHCERYGVVSFFVPELVELCKRCTAAAVRDIERVNG